MNVNLSVEVPNHEENSDVRESAMGGKLQRNLSLSAKWASDKAMAIEYLRRQREIMTWIESVLKRELPTTDLFEALKSGVVLREMMETLFPDVSNCMSPISRNYSKRMAPWKERENISVFLRQCKSIGMYDLSLFCTDDLYEGTNMVQVLFCVQHFMMFSEEHAGHLFKPVPKNEPAEFSNQELEMAMAKIEQAGVDVSALKGLISVGASAVPERAAIPEKKDIVRTASNPTPVSPTEKILVRVQEEEPAESEECPEEKKAEIEVCNQASEDKQDIDNPADDDDLNPEQESGSDAGDDEAVTELEDTSVPVQEIYAVEVPVPTSELPTAEDEETTAVIQQVLSDLTTAIEEDESEAQMKTTQEVLVVQAEPEAPTVQDISIPDEVEELLTIPAEDLVVEVKAEPVEQTEVKIEVAEVVEARDVDLADTPAESTTVEEVVIAQPSVAATEKEAGSPIEDEELEAKAMAKCTCGRCTIM
ncbi:hypothetical protein PR003_g3936 [Phytophthora rubi]|uniref:Calponin-homology (CH) domain-containing protein n=2 Tax=Phytophthora rubi TaxID=129364 RepID=A0A6A3NI95_9STRA|nr:hypothetical protein PR002_g4197 [Phytophthora rubi]KAE9046695.1 hypothetical protein PR001_g4455 [Phytophthora rubi]KAE9353310.1 hypothetical protein PR003_g3936 [Phytophthora rubi]